MKVYRIPDEMVEAAWNRQGLLKRSEVRDVLHAALHHLINSPIVPTEIQLQDLRGDSPCDNQKDHQRWIVTEWQRRMFLVPEQKALEEVDEEKERFRSALEELAKLGNGPHYGNSGGNRIAQKALRVGWDALKVEETAYGRVTQAMGAVTLSREEGEKIIEYVRGAIHG